LNRGQRLTEILKQGQYNPLPFSKQILIIFAGTSGALDDVAVQDCRPFEKALYEYVETVNPGLLRAIEEKKVLDDNLKAEMAKAVKEAKEKFVGEKTMAAAK
jgi:F-type H+-transporting ATPase subunit alpha